MVTKPGCAEQFRTHVLIMGHCPPDQMGFQLDGITGDVGELKQDTSASERCHFKNSGYYCEHTRQKGEIVIVKQKLRRNQFLSNYKCPLREAV